MSLNIFQVNRRVCQIKKIINLREDPIFQLLIFRILRLNAIIRHVKRIKENNRKQQFQKLYKC